MKSALTIAGSDSSGGAGIQADIKTMCANRVFATSAITALTVQNTLGVTGIMDVTPEFLAQELDAVFTDIYPNAVKIGMVSEPYIVEEIAEELRKYKAVNIVLDPVMVSTSGKKLITKEAEEVLIKKLMPLATVITPNIPEAESLSGITINDRYDMEKAAEIIYKKININDEGPAVLVKGGHSINCANDYLYTEIGTSWFEVERVDNPNTHGTGCTLSSAIACNIAEGYSVKESVARAKEYITGALKAGLNIGKGSGPLNHMYVLDK